MSAPAANTLGPPDTTTAPMSSRSPTSAEHASISSQTCWDMAFIGGRSSRIVATRVSASTSSRTNSPTDRSLLQGSTPRGV